VEFARTKPRGEPGASEQGQSSSAPSDADDLWFFPVDNTRSGTGDDPVVAALRDAVEAAIRDDPLGYLRQVVPYAWLGVADELEAMRDDRYVSVGDVERVAAARGVPAREVPEMLGLFHELGVCLWFSSPEPLSRQVVLDAQWLIDSTTAVIRDFDLHAKRRDRRAKRMLPLWRALKERGILDRRLLAALWHGHDESVRDFTLALLHRFGLVCRIDPEDEVFLVPSLSLRPRASREPADAEVEARPPRGRGPGRLCPAPRLSDGPHRVRHGAVAALRLL
jgi:hypothetical protein